MYWWTNIAVPETHDTACWRRRTRPSPTCNAGVAVMPVPVAEGADVTYASNLQSSREFFFRIPETVWPWIAAPGPLRPGLVQASTGRLRGGRCSLGHVGPGGRRWQEFLERPAHLHRDPGRPGAHADAIRHDARPRRLVVGGGIRAADAHVDARDAPRRRFRTVARAAGVQKRVPDGSSRCRAGGGACARRGMGRSAARRDPPTWSRAGARSTPPPSSRPGAAMVRAWLVFDDASLGSEQELWVGLLRGDALPDVATPAEPHGLVVDDEWRTRWTRRWLRAGVRTGWPGGIWACCASTQERLTSRAPPIAARWRSPRRRGRCAIWRCWRWKTGS